MSSNKIWKTILCTMKLEKSTSRLNLRIRLKIYFSKPEKSIVRRFSFQVGAEVIFYAKISSICVVKSGIDKYHENSLS